MDLNVAMRMVAAAEAAAEAARAATNLASRSASEDQGKSWWKLLPRPPVFDQLLKGVRDSRLERMELDV
jgi:hypothetical protein